MALKHLRILHSSLFNVSFLQLLVGSLQKFLIIHLRIVGLGREVLFEACEKLVVSVVVVVVCCWKGGKKGEKG